MEVLSQQGTFLGATLHGGTCLHHYGLLLKEVILPFLLWTGVELLVNAKGQLCISNQEDQQSSRQHEITQSAMKTFAYNKGSLVPSLGFSILNLHFALTIQNLAISFSTENYIHGAGPANLHSTDRHMATYMGLFGCCPRLETVAQADRSGRRRPQSNA
ncbi:uncharacterized protein LOC102717656 isoform X2 [Oryza brachyantha]|uniref:uncharacterized protein LOC102717656 isoform X2 n=1 Tax=Oryza brachyantha TaxID=4533 RepID=UPI001ADD136A|nr:uncharacterized protein LOC102717656 isoform X2 [Oryza brachyantha]